MNDPPRRNQPLDYGVAGRPPRERLTGRFWVVTLIIVGGLVLTVDICGSIQRDRRNARQPLPTTQP
jgi:hypothetical protein